MEGAFFKLIGIQFQEKRKLKVELHKLLSESLVYGSITQMKIGRITTLHDYIKYNVQQKCRIRINIFWYIRGLIHVYTAQEVFSQLVLNLYLRCLIFNVKILLISTKFDGIGRILTFVYFWFIIKNSDLKSIKVI